MDPFHERLARVGLAAGGQYGLALAGGYAVQAAGLLERSSEDVDLFTSHRESFDTAANAVISAYESDGLAVEVAMRADTFARLLVTEGEHRSKVELAVDWRARPAVMMAVGPVLHPDDAVANKMAALFGRTEARDLIDVEAAGRVGGYSRSDLLQLATATDPGFDERIFAGQIDRGLRLLPDAEFAQYGVSGRRLAELRAWFTDWRDELLS